ncbi:ATP-grasp domain-containing protein [Ensifer aridi]|uniref:ATP-grasp domain-containing protein n=1 Tax=Ensifer aridi TaxID=1708715 RepID=UPI00047AE746|nr:acetyl-CoA carboxylase biotin carboxylase subunit family protein [Ensifer aridi]MCA1442126.1 acetyl-CoA carboxylase biotin carboxylase subunit family protein [Ensifer sp. IC4062]
MLKRALILVEGHRHNGPLYIQAAKRLGLHPITFSADPSNYDYLASEELEVVRVDTDDLEAIIRECSQLSARYDIGGITGFTGLDESLYVTVAKLCRHFGLPGPNPASIEQCCDKFTQRQRLAETDIPMPVYRLTADATETKEIAAEIGLPVIVKPTIGSGSSGVRLCRNVEEVSEHATNLLSGGHKWQSSPRLLVEEFAPGPSYQSHIMSNQIIGVTGNDFGPPPHFVYREFTYPAMLADQEYKDIADISQNCVRALGLDWGPANIEIRWTKHGPVVIEVNPRLAGEDPHLVQLAHGIDLVNEHIKLVIGEEWNLRRTRSHTAAVRYLVPDRDGILEWIGSDSRAAAVSGVVEVKFYKGPKTPIVRKGDYRDCLGHVIAASPSGARTAAILHDAADLVDWSIAPFPTVSE